MRENVLSFSIFIQTLNEEINLPGLLDSVAFADDIVVLDSFSRDRTKDIAIGAGCRWFEREFDGRASHQNWAMENIDFVHRWVFYLDADERMTDELRAELDSIVAAWDAGHFDVEKGSPVAYFCGRKNYFRGRWLKHSMPPSDILRFFQPQRVRFERLANPVPRVDGNTGYLRSHFLHYNFSKGLSEWFDRHNRYSSYEAIENTKAIHGNPVRFINFLSRDRNKRRMELKNWSFRMPGRPFLKFIFLYFFNLGFLDGRPGLTYCILQAIYEYQIVLKVKEIIRSERGLPPS